MPPVRTRQLLISSGLLLLTGIASSCWALDSTVDAAARARPFAVGEVTCSVIAPQAVGDSVAPAQARAVAQARKVACKFRPGINGTEETYIGTLQGAGQVEALFDKGVVMLLVKQARSSAVTPGMLAQTYSADATMRAGLATPLTGDTNASVILQPMFERGLGDADKEAPVALIVRIELKLRSSVA